MTNNEFTPLDCGLCGAALTGADPRRGWYSDGEDIARGDCKAVNSVSCDGESDPYVGRWMCSHGKDDETPCDECDIEDGSGVGEVVT